MDRSYSSTLLATPTPLDRRSGPSSSSASLSSSALLAKHQLAQSLAPSASSLSTSLGATTTVQPLSFNPKTAPIRQTQSSFLPSSSSGASGSPAKNVRFSPAHSSVANGSFQSQYSSAPPSRVQSFATPSRRSYSSPSASSSSLLRTAQQNHASSTPPRQQYTAPVQHAKHLLHSADQKVHSALAKAALPVKEVKEKLRVAPLGRGEAARRLRVNAVGFVACWVASRTTAYRFAAGHLILVAPQLDTPLHLVESLILLLLCYNIIDSLRLLNRLSSLSSASAVASPLFTSSPSRPGPARPSSPTAVFTMSSPARSSPKTRPSPSSFSPSSPSSPSLSNARMRTTSSPFRASALASPTLPTPQTPTSALRSGGADSVAASSAIRRSGSSIYGTPLGLKTGGQAPAAELDGVSTALLAYEARHSPGAGGAKGAALESPASARKVQVDSREEIERLFE